MLIIVIEKLVVGPVLSEFHRKKWEWDDKHNNNNNFNDNGEIMYYITYKKLVPTKYLTRRGLVPCYLP